MIGSAFWRPFLAVAAAAVLCGGAAAQQNTDGLTSVIVVLRPLPAGEAAFDPASVGGIIEHRSAFRMVIRVPEDAIDDVRGHAGVRSVQRAGTGFPDRRAASATRSFEIGADGTGVWSTGPYAYDGRGSITTVGPGSNAKTDQYLYDSLNRIKSSTVHAGTSPSTQSFQYDQYGNLTARTTGTTTVPTPADPNTNRLTSTTGALYDPAGSMTRDPLGRVYDYDPAGMPSARTNDEAYLYTADDERIAVIELGANTWNWTLRDMAHRVVREYESVATGTAQQSFLWVSDHYHAGGRAIAADLDAGQGGRRHYHLDHLGSTRLVTNGAGERISSHTYHPFGAEATSIMQERERGYEREAPFRFTGHERDGLEDDLGQHALYLDYMHARYYSPHWGRFLTVDPGKDWQPNRAQSWNSYAYVRNNPLKTVDPSGKFARDVMGGEGAMSALLAAARWGPPSSDSFDANNLGTGYYAAVYRDHFGILTHEAVIGYVDGKPVDVWEISPTIANRKGKPNEGVPFAESQAATSGKAVVMRFLGDGFDPRSIQYNPALTPLFKLQVLQCADYSQFLQEGRFPMRLEIPFMPKVDLSDRITPGFFFRHLKAGYKPVR